MLVWGSPAIDMWVWIASTRAAMETASHTHQKFLHLVPTLKRGDRFHHLFHSSWLQSSVLELSNQQSEFTFSRAANPICNAVLLVVFVTRSGPNAAPEPTRSTAEILRSRASRNGRRELGNLPSCNKTTKLLTFLVFSVAMCPSFGMKTQERC